MKHLLLAFCLSFLSLFSIAQNSNIDTVVIKTSAQCEMCKERIIGEVILNKGVKKADLDLSTSDLTVVFNNVKTNPEHLREVVSEIGYSADDLPPNEDAYSRLPDCCKKPEDQEGEGHQK